MKSSAMRILIAFVLLLSVACSAKTTDTPTRGFAPQEAIAPESDDTEGVRNEDEPEKIEEREVEPADRSEEEAVLDESEAPAEAAEPGDGDSLKAVDEDVTVEPAPSADEAPRKAKRRLRSKKKEKTKGAASGAGLDIADDEDEVVPEDSEDVEAHAIPVTAD